MIDDPDVRVLLGDALEQLATLPAESVQCIVTSPPFWGLRDYGTATWRGGDPACDHLGPPMRTKANLADSIHSTRGGANHVDREPVPGDCPRCGAQRIDDQIGLEATPDEWCQRLVEVFRECRRVLRSDGVLWLEVGDSYNGSSATAGGDGTTSGLMRDGRADESRVTTARRTQGYYTAGNAPPKRAPGAKPKDLVGAPWMLAFALRADGWYLRSDTIWGRPNPMPESVTDRPTKAHSYVFLLTKSARYFYDADAIREPVANDPSAGGRQRAATRGESAADSATFLTDETDTGRRGRLNGGALTQSANARSVWWIATQPTPFAHFATFPEELVRRCIAAGTSERGCCPECGAPWTRITERTLEPHQKTWNVRDGGGDTHAATGLKASGHMSGTPSVQTTGWEPPACTCEETLEPVPCVVLDPFMGSGTTALVARKMGRRAVGIELNGEYLAIAAERLSQQSLFA